MQTALFQSTPDYLNRENNTLAPAKLVLPWFQSTPDYLNRENKPIGNFVVFATNLFQSTPDYLNRENPDNHIPGFVGTVSIHSRLFKPGESIKAQV